MALSDKLKDAVSIVKVLEDERRTNEDDDARKISEYLLPHRGYWLQDGQDKKSILERGKKNINPAATLSLERAAGGLTTGMTPEGQPWFGLKLSDKKAMEASGVREDLDTRKSKIDTVLRSGGFYQAIHLCNQELLGFPGMMLFADNSVKTLLRFECCTFGTYAIALDEEGNLDTVARWLRWSARRLEKKFGKAKLTKSTKEMLDDNPYEKVDIVHLVRPREKRERGKIDNRNMAYESIMYEAKVTGDGEAQAASGATDVLSESGFHEMPYFFAPFARVGASDYGMSPGHLLIGHTKQLNETERQKLIALQKLVSPPMKKPGNMKGVLNVGPGAETAINSSDPRGLEPLYAVPHQGYQYALQEIQDVMTRIAAVAKADLFYDLPQEMRPKDMTATEYMERKRERMQQIAPVISIYEPNILDKVIVRAHNALDRIGAFGPPPPAMEQVGVIEVEYISSIAKALRQVGAESTRAFMLDIKGLIDTQAATGGPVTVHHKVDFAQAVDEIATGIGVPAAVVRDDDAYAELVDADAKRRAAEMEKQEQMAQADAAAKIGSVPSTGTVLSEAVRQEA